MSQKKKILLLSPYDTLSHQYWWQGLKNTFEQYQWTILTLEPRYYSWRIRGNSLSWAYEQKATLEQKYDLLIACSLTDLSSLRGFIPSLARIPTIVYCHENQFFYPENPEQSKSQNHRLEQQMIQLYNFVCADRIVFNSEFNRQTCLAGIESLFKRLPDHIPTQLPNELTHKSQILPIPLYDADSARRENKTKNFSIVWNHRWEYDKGLKQLSELINRIVNQKLPCKIHLLGQQFRVIPEDMKVIINKLKSSNLNGHIGFIENREQYFELLKQSHLVLSTSLHEFQGLAIMEAAQHGCIPLLPKRLSYPEFFNQEFLYESHPENLTQESDSAYFQLERRFYQWQKNQLPPSDITIKNIPTWENKKAAYQQVIDSFIKAT